MITFKDIENQEGTWVKQVKLYVIDVSPTEEAKYGGLVQVISAEDCEGRKEQMEYLFSDEAFEIIEDPPFKMWFRVRDKVDWFQARPEEATAREIIQSVTKGDNVNNILKGTE